MKILLVGEFSGFFSNLKQGFNLLGHDVTMIANQDGWKKIKGADITISSDLPSIFGKISERLQYLLKIIFLKKFDIILIVNPNIGINYISGVFSSILRKKSQNIYLSACGTDMEYVQYGMEGKFDYWPFDECKEQSMVSSKTHNNIINIVDYVIPTFYDYAEPWRNSEYKEKVFKTIPLPINTSNIKTYYPNIKGKIVFFHGLNAECKKGTKYIKQALENIQIKYPNDTEVIIDGQMPLDEYLELMKRVDVVVDQCKAYSYGSMNSLYALSMGKVLMASFRDECMIEYDIKEEIEGIVHITPEIEYIEKKIEYIIKNKKNLYKWGKQNRKYVEEKHDSKIIAKKYIEVLEKNL